MDGLVDRLAMIVSELVWGAQSFGVLLGLVIGPFRISGVDFGKWYRDPGEVSEGLDRSWIGAMRTAVLFVARTFWILLAVTLALALLWVCWRWAVRRETLQLVPPEDLVGWYWRTTFCFIVGVFLAQTLLEIAWRVGKWFATVRGPLVHLARRPVLPRVTRSSTALPPGHTPRRLVICCDGTWNRPEDGKDTNIVRLARAIKPVDDRNGSRVDQIVRYHLGIGTGNILDRLVGGGAGIGLSASVKTCYGFLVDNYLPGDEILLFGFSRGAYVVRSIAGLIGLVGLLHKSEMVRFEEVWSYYRLPCKEPQILDQLAPDRTTAEKVDIACIGVWDTVGALGIPGSRFCSSTYAFHDTALGRHVQHAFQALALDESRGNFQPAVWAQIAQNQVLEQVWFPGVHSNIGGGYEEHGLADASFLWMLSRLWGHGLLDFDFAVVQSALEQHKAEQYARGKIQDSRSWGWKAVFSAVPRPVCLTDPSERIHDSAFRRVGDAYAAGTPRWRWLNRLRRRALLLPLETARRFAFTGPGAPRIPLVPSADSWCGWLTTKILGEQ